MKRTLNNRRLAAIKQKFVLFPHECECCSGSFALEKMWVVKRWGINKTTHKWYYCKNCKPTKQHVLKSVDSDSCYFGIAYVDPF